MLFSVSGPSTASAQSCIGDASAEQGAIHISGSRALLDCECNAQAAQAAHACHFKPLKLKCDLSWPKSPPKARVEPDWPHLLKEDPVRYMALYTADYIHTMEPTNLKWNKTRATPPSIAVRK
jgi:hypothetical protein